jgi:hypothetical protein
MPALPDAQARQRQGREPSLSAVSDARGARPLQGRAADAGIHSAPGRRREAGLRTQRRQALVRKAQRPARAVAPRVFGRRSVRLPPGRQDGTDAGDDFIFTCKPTSHKTLYDFIDGAELRRHEEKVRRRNTKETFRYRWIEAVPLRDGKDALLVNWIGFEIVDAKGKGQIFHGLGDQPSRLQRQCRRDRRLRPGALENRERELSTYRKTTDANSSTISAMVGRFSR